MNYPLIIYNFIMVLFGSVALSIFFHELGHIITIAYYNKKFPKISFENFVIFIGEEKEIRQLSNDRKQIVYFSGILLGLYCLIHLTIFYNTFVLVTIPIYLIGCKRDIMNIIELIKNE